ncbi:MAG: hypothetical protein ISS29_01120 [Candidatus Marinimicrobia bacterium]|nr:hypothetical protein [Candidatus Neomarinimicrobiota bacterium]
MKTTHFFNSKRFFLLLRNDLLRNYRTMLVSAGAVAALYFVITLPSIFFSPGNASHDFHLGFYPALLFIGGFILSSSAFSEIHHSQKNTSFFMLPASIFEKMVSKLLLTTIGYVPASILLYYLLTVTSSGIAAIFTDWSFPAFNPFNREILLSVAIYLVTQSMFLFGGLYFKKHPFMKTLFSQFAITFVLTIFAFLVVRFIYRDCFHGMRFIDEFMFNDMVSFEHLGNNLARIFKYLFWICLAPYFWILSYMRLGETEV